MHNEALALINANNISLSDADSIELEEAFQQEGITPSTHCPNGDKLFRLAEYKMRITEMGVANDSDRPNLQLTCNICKNDIGLG